MKNKEFSVQDLTSDWDGTIILTLCEIVAGVLSVIFIFGLMFLAALFT